MVRMYASSVCLDDDVEMVKERRNVNNKAEENKKKRLIFLSRLGDLNIASAPLLCQTRTTPGGLAFSKF